MKENVCTALVAALGKVRQSTPALSYGDYKELVLQTGHYAFARSYEGQTVIVTVNNQDGDVQMNLPAGDAAEYIGALSGQKVSVTGGRIDVTVKANSGEIWVPYTGEETFEPVMKPIEKKEAPKPEVKAEPVKEAKKVKAVEQVKETEEPQKTEEIQVQKKTADQVTVDWNKPYEEMSIAELQEGILEKMRKNGPVTEQIKRDVAQNTHQGSLINWIRSFR